jgi:hypothetical protein
MMEAICSSETSVIAKAIRRQTPEDGILHCLFIRPEEHVSVINISLYVLSNYN